MWCSGDRGWASGPAEKGGGHGRHPRLPDGDAGGLLPGVSGGRWVKAAETQLTKTPQPQVTQTLSEQTALSSLEVCIRGTSGEDSITRNSRVSIDNVHHATKKANKGVTTNKTKRKRTETDPEVSDVYQHIRGMLEESDANFTSSKIYLTKGKLSETQNRF